VVHIEINNKEKITNIM